MTTEFVRGDTMPGVPKLALSVAVLVSLAALGTVPAGAQSTGDKPTATEVGVTPSQIHIATIADVDNPFVPGLFDGARIGAEAAAQYLNSKAGGGGVAGRKLVVDFIDSQLNANKSRNSVITACQNDFAMVGGAVLFLTSADDLLGCPDKSGAKTGLPDMPSFSAGIVESCTPVTFGLNPPQLDCSTQFATKQRYTNSVGMARWLQKKFGKLHGAMLYPIDTKDAERGGRSILDAVQKAGIKADQYKGISATTPQSGYTPIVAQMKADRSNYAQAIGGNPALLKAEAQLQGITDHVVYIGAYTHDAATNPVMDDTWAGVGYVPFEEASTNAMLQDFLKLVPRAKADPYAVYGWSAVLAFAQAAKAVVAKSGVNGLTRAALLKDGVTTLTNFDAGGMFGTTDIARHQLTRCFAVVHLTGGKFVRAYPAKKGTLDCRPSNVVTTQGNYGAG